MQLLTASQVAKLLQISARTVYDNKNRLGGFYPAGIRALRFRKEVIDGILERSEAQGLDLPISVRGEKLRRPRVQDEGLGADRQVRAPKVPQEKVDTSDRRHGF